MQPFTPRPWNPGEREQMQEFIHQVLSEEGSSPRQRTTHGLTPPPMYTPRGFSTPSGKLPIYLDVPGSDSKKVIFVSPNAKFSDTDAALRAKIPKLISSSFEDTDGALIDLDDDDTFQHFLQTRTEFRKPVLRCRVAGPSPLTVSFNYGDAAGGPVYHTAIMRSDPTRFITAGKAGIRVWSYKNSLPVRLLPMPCITLACDSGSSGTHIALSAGINGSLVLWDTVTGEQRWSAPTPNTIYSVSYSSGGQTFASVGVEGTLRVWATATGDLLMQGRRVHTSTVFRVCPFPSDTNHFITSSEDKTAAVSDTRQGGAALPVRRFEGHAHAVWSAVASRDGSKVLTASMDNTIRLWDVGTQKVIVTAPTLSAAHHAMFRSSNQNEVLSCTHDGALQRWDISGSVPTVVCSAKAHGGAAYSVVEMLDGVGFLSCAKDGVVKEWV